MFVVNLQGTSSGLGFSIQGGTDASPDPIKCIPRVKAVFPMGHAASKGKLRSGDVLLQANQHKLKGLMHAVSGWNK